VHALAFCTHVSSVPTRPHACAAHRAALTPIPTYLSRGYGPAARAEARAAHSALARIIALRIIALRLVHGLRCARRSTLASAPTSPQPRSGRASRVEADEDSEETHSERVAGCVASRSQMRVVHFLPPCDVIILSLSSCSESTGSPSG